MITIDYQCADGTPFPVTFEDEASAARTWVLDREHSAEPHTPLGEALGRLGQPGTDRAYADAGIPRPAPFGPAPRASGFPYFPEEMLPGDLMLEMVEGCRRLLETWGSALRIWHDYALPKTKAAVEFLDRAGHDVPLADLACEQGYGMHMTMVPAYVCFGDLDLMKGALTELYGERAEIVAYELTQGYDNTTLSADQALWELGRAAIHDDAVMAALRSADAASSMRALRASGDASTFFGMVDRFLAEFGARAESWDIAYPTWNEQQNGFWCQLEQLSDAAAPAPAEAIAKAAQRRDQLAGEIRARLAATPEALARFERRYERLRDYVAIREERALWQVALAGSLRHAMLRRGAKMVSQSLLDDSTDVLYLLPQEVEDPPRDARAIAARRRSEHESWRHRTPPAVVGGQTAAAVDTTSPVLPDDGVLRGTAASRGLATGTARVITDLADADRLDAGDVLVCVMTAPPWTPLFGLAAAVVADSGGISSHPAIAAREYGIPCVLGTRVATSVIPDGATVTVDGEQGTVSVVA